MALRGLADLPVAPIVTSGSFHEFVLGGGGLVLAYWRPKLPSRSEYTPRTSPLPTQKCFLLLTQREDRPGFSQSCDDSRRSPSIKDGQDPHPRKPVTGPLC